ncbi:MAG: peptidoglycan-binding protein [Neomegalonema sp.]|nr:peptidoglycan-binding protein [Neomegalonema sp.]
MMGTAKYAAAVGALVAAFAATPAAAQGLPDLVVNVERSKILSTSCKTGQPLAVVRVAVDNIGEASARRSTAIGLPSVASVSAEHAPYTYSDVTSRNHIDPGEIAAVVITIGEGVRKAGRIGKSTTGVTAVTTAKTIAQQRRLPRGLREEIQRKLQSAGYYKGGIDGVFGRGTEAAIRAFQKSRSEEESGVLTADQTDALLAGGPSRSAFTSTGEDRVVRLIVIVDPKNLVRESDEDNNIWITDPIRLTDC